MNEYLGSVNCNHCVVSMHGLQAVVMKFFRRRSHSKYLKLCLQLLRGKQLYTGLYLCLSITSFYYGI